ncbi:16S rRNA (guanine(966)-N(2))-methyltransferase RsmD [Prosthecochloris sp. GSB1]|uniref:16S rRNA (guanine(966)-N(2))-methyltransferase RsmD n=1 Tax=Prosthecochloris sp. GSB1 TaxID=281093 RepID=UPI000B8D19AC|nr:16S rRNA (guanine(966)-N(2))-methyltransferase RsmD [Prosthecochloris sp. GSB1]ASQ90299.1 16S rRNA (guanine(966)-N(2))-methyltransferase RsmD [Prosthecochloris sp. GSB1]
MHIQAGIFKGKRLHGSATGAVRPCSARVKKSLFDIISVRMDLSGTSVLDLFAGFGSLGFEALSRGADRVCFVDLNQASLRALRSSAGELGVLSRARIVKRDVSGFIASEQAAYDLVFCDPPYHWPDYGKLVRGIFDKGLLAEHGMLLIEHSRRHSFENDPHYAFHKDYGNTRVTFFLHPEDAAPGIS